MVLNYEENPKKWMMHGIQDTVYLTQECNKKILG